MATKRKEYSLRLSVEVIEGAGSTYDPPKPVRFTIEEKLPANVDAQQYIRRRLAEEVKRNFDALIEPIANKTEEALAEEDPLSSQ